MLFMSKPFVVEAVCWKGHNVEALSALIGDTFVVKEITYNVIPPTIEIWVDTEEGKIKLDIGDFVVKFDDGSASIMDKEMFSKSFYALGD